MAFNTVLDLESLVVNTKAATVYTAHENSLFLSGGIVPMVNLPAGSITAQIPLMGSVTAQKLGDLAGNIPANEDFDVLTVTDQSKTITADIYAARHVMRDLGGIDPQETGRVLGNAIQAKFDADVIAAMNAEFTPSADTDSLDVNDLFDAAAQIRANGESGALTGLVSPAAAAELMKVIGTNAYGGGDFQSEAMRNGFLGQIAGIRMFSCSYITGTTKGFVFAQDAARIAMFKNIDLEVARRAEAVGNDIVANLHAGVGVIDATRGVKLVDAA